jgi:hypothetical protein
MMKVRRFTRRFHYSTIALALMSVGPLSALAQDGHSHLQTPQANELTPDQKSKASALLQKVREATERFQNVEVAEANGYELQFGCVSADSVGAMGLHYVNGALVNKGEVNVKRPQIVIYEPTADGHLRLVGADYEGAVPPARYSPRPRLAPWRAIAAAPDGPPNHSRT